MKRLSGFVLAAAMAAGIGCGGGGGAGGGHPPGNSGGAGGGRGAAGSGGASAGDGAAGQGGGGGTDGVTLVGWVDDLVEGHTNAVDPPDTVEDKLGIIIDLDTQDTAAFNPLLQKQTP